MIKPITLFLLCLSHFQGFSQCQANAGNDTTITDGTIVTLGTTHLQTNKNLVYNWSPNPIGLSCRNCPSPTLNYHDNIELTLTVTDTVTHCTSSDKIFITVLPFEKDQNMTNMDIIKNDTWAEPPPPEIKIEDEVVEPDEPAQFPGGKSAYIEYLKNQLMYPQKAIEEGLEGNCWVGFIVDKDGNLSNIIILKKVPGCPECDAEALRIIKKIPKFIPGKVGGKPVKSRWQVPVTFQID